GFLGAGRMAAALARAWTASGRFVPEHTLASDPLPAARDAFTRDTGCQALADNRAVAFSADVLVLAVKPQTMPAVLPEIRDSVQARRPLIISIAAGITLGQLQGVLGTGARLVRVMPNTPCLVGASASAFCPGE